LSIIALKYAQRTNHYDEKRKGETHAEQKMGKAQSAKYGGTGAWRHHETHQLYLASVTATSPRLRERGPEGIKDSE
jgi:hypothetical protein